MRKEPRWLIPFLRALARTGEVRTAAEDAGIDHTTAYARRRSHAEFACRWDAALAAHEEQVKAEQEGQLAALAQDPSTIASSGNGSPPRDKLGEELVGAGSQLKRAGNGRWSKAKEKAFFDELAATANVKRAAKAAGVSPNAVYARRMRDAHFRAKWAAVLETGRASIEMHLVEAANKSFDPDEIDTGEIQPKVSVAEAIRIVQVHGSKKQQEMLSNPFAEQPAAMTEEQVEEARERLFNKLERLRKREMPRWLAQGWIYDEEHDALVPPGWLKP